MRTILKAGVAALALTFVVSAAHAQEKLSIYHWFEYIPQELLDKFSAETGIEVTMDTFDSNEAMLATLKAGKLGSYDVAVPGDYMVEIMIGEGMLDTVADGELANKGNIQPQWLDVPFDPGRKHSIPYQWGSTSFSVNRDVYQGDINDTSHRLRPAGRAEGQDQRARRPGRGHAAGLAPSRHSRSARPTASSSRRSMRCCRRPSRTGPRSTPTAPRTSSSPATPPWG